MKTKTLIITLLIFTSICKAQISLEHSYLVSSKNTYIGVVNLTNSGYKYSLTDNTNNTVKLYNLNHSLWKTISFVVPVGYTIYMTVGDISEALFNTDALVELSYSYYKTTPTIDLETKIINENGNVLLTIPNCVYHYIASTGTNGWKLLATIDSANTYSTAHLDVYSLVGTMPVTMIAKNEVNYNDVLSYPYPNPSQTNTRINYQLPKGTNLAEIVFFNLNGQEVKRFKVDNTFNTLELNNSDLPAGTYLYHLVTSNNFSSAKQMVVIK